ncbi:MAG: RNA ligase family protein [Solirubrobacteraceae bacterium]|nr:RNA ligase family protein [Solirubrobacteraceae bacterium]
MADPPPYPRIPHIVVGRNTTPDDLVVADAAGRDLVRRDVQVEEKLDGSNVVIWVDDGVPRVATRGGADTMDRSGQRGRVRAWAMEHAGDLVEALGDRLALYAEWLLLRHGVPYDRLPSPLVVLDLYDRDAGRFLDTAERDRIAQRVGVPVPPTVYVGTLGAPERLLELLGPSRYADARAEGLVVRTGAPDDDGAPRIAKLVDDRWQRPTDEQFARREENVVVPTEDADADQERDRD